MARYHVSEDGTPRVCKASSPERCTARGLDGDSAPHGDFSSPTEARGFAEKIIEQHLKEESSSNPSKDAQLAEDLSASVRDFRNPATTADERESIKDFWSSQGVPNQFAAALKAGELRKIANPPVPDRKLISTAMDSDVEYRVESGRLKESSEDGDYDYGVLQEVSKAEASLWSKESFVSDLTESWLNNEVITAQDEAGRSIAYMRSGDKWYRTDLA